MKPFYHGLLPGQIKLLIGLIILITIITLSGKFINWQNYTNPFNKESNNVDLVNLLSFANFYSGKNICTQGYYAQSNKLSIIKVSLDEDISTRSAWVNNPGGEKLIIDASNVEDKAVEAKVCGYFESGRSRHFGEPSVWNHQITVDKFKPLGYSFPFKFNY